MTQPRVAALVGPTAAGKSALALDVAESLGAEIVSVDSMQAYREMDIGTDKPGSEARRRVVHHMVDVVDPEHELTVAEFQKQARAAIAGIVARDKMPLLVGGSGLYFRATVDDLDIPPTAQPIREALESEMAAQGSAALHRRLAVVDPVAASRIEATNARRIVRALEVIELTGKRFSDNASWQRYESVYRLTVAGLTRPRPELFDRIARRVDRMLEAGLVDEARALRARGIGRTASQALGYRQVFAWLDAGEPKGLDGLRAEIVRATKRFARSQESWFRSDPRVVWFDASEPGTASQLISHFAPSLEVP